MAKKTASKGRPRTSATLNGHSIEIEFRDPPPQARQPLQLPVEFLKKHSGKWAVIGKKGSKSSAYGAAQNLKKRVESEGIEGFEIRAGEDEVFARFVG